MMVETGRGRKNGSIHMKIFGLMMRLGDESIEKVESVEKADNDNVGMLGHGGEMKDRETGK